MRPEYPGAAAFIPAVNYTKTRGSNGTVTRIVIHDEEYPETSTSAEVIARMFSTTTREASAHFVVDDNSIIQCVPLDCRAWHAPPNLGSIGIEHAGYAKQTRAQWLDAFGMRMLRRSAELTAWLCRRYAIPVRRPSVAELRSHAKGIYGHLDVTDAFHETDHTDPGKNFPWDVYLSMVRGSYPGGVMATLDKEDIEKVSQETFSKIFNYVLPGSTLNVQTVLKRTYEGVNRLEAGMDPETLAREIAGAIGPIGTISTENLAETIASVLSKRLES